MKKTSFALALMVVAALGAVANAATIEYRVLINDVLAPSHVLASGTHNLKVEGRVLDNVVTGANMGGFIQASFDLEDSANLIKWKEGVGFLGAPSGAWDSTANAKFGNHNAGVLQDNGTNVLQETSSILQANWNADFGAVGANEWSTIATGQFDYTQGAPTTLTLASSVAVNSIATLNGAAIGGKAPDGVTGYSTVIGIPEPATLAMAGLGLIGMMATGRRRQA
jgi:hypothetical protein